jgi:hypothetical protein
VITSKFSLKPLHIGILCQNYSKLKTSLKFVTIYLFASNNGFTSTWINHRKGLETATLSETNVAYLKKTQKILI